MEKARISGWQLFMLITFFEIGSAFLVGLAMDAKQDAWIAILVGMISSYALIFMYYRLHRYYPYLALTEYTEKIIGKVRGRILAFLYILYFANGAARFWGNASYLRLSRYAAVLGLSHMFKIKNPSPLVFPIGLVILFYSLSLAQNYFEHIYEGLNIIPFTLHLSFQIVIPALLLVIAFLRNQKKYSPLL
ncbi:spore germination protein [Priestia aryabhattai]|uniref:GerAB/ArcD/ProY family transporter n=1 Tax=Priestia aryabhattai TaxID=412384 RepID=UPI002378171A|nr:GerAB/ArcD/ProY family transporter [Priestia aryabhattai]WDL86388.1 spore germination protein [Priestia aryabhattai]